MTKVQAGNGSYSFNYRDRLEMDIGTIMTKVNRIWIFYYDEKGKQDMDIVTTMTKVDRKWISQLR